MATRKLGPREVGPVVLSPEQIVNDEDSDDRLIYQSHYVDKRGKLMLLRVVVEETREEIVVITAYPTSQIKRYWEEL